MRPRLILLLLIAIGALSSSAYILISSGSDKNACQEKCNLKPTPSDHPASGGTELMNDSFDHFIVSNIK